MNMIAIFAVIYYRWSSVHYCENLSHILFLTPPVNTEILPQQQEPSWRSKYTKVITKYEPRYQCPPNVQVNFSAEGSIGRWNFPRYFRSKQNND